MPAREDASEQATELLRAGSNGEEGAEKRLLESGWSFAGVWLREAMAGAS